MSARDRILTQQKAWAAAAGLRVIAPGHAESVEANLQAPMHPSTLAAFQAEEAAELKEFPRYPAKLRALCSSAALVVNVFDWWSGRDSAPLLAALELKGPARRLEFEARFPISDDGTPPNVDLAIRLASGRCVGIESKFTEWHVPRRPAKIRFKDKYFPAGAKLWTSRGLPRCQALAEELQDGRSRYRFLYATQLLKHALGMATQCPGGIAVHYLYYEWSGPAARAHRREIEQFAGRVGEELAFRALSYQELFERLCRSCGPADADYLQYLRLRYFGA